MRRTVLIHLGAHRTGTTYLQCVFRGNSEALAERGITYLGLADAPEMQAALVRARHALGDGKPELFEREFATVAAFLARFVREHPRHNLLISYEGFLGDLSLRRGRKLYPMHAILLEKLTRIFEGESVHMAFSVREQGALIESGYKYLVQVGLRHRFRSYMAGISLSEISWLGIIRSLKRTSGDACSMWTYEDFARCPAALLDWLFRRAFGIEANFLTLRDEPGNPSLSRTALPALLLVNRFVPMNSGISEGVYRLLRRCLPARRFGAPNLLSESAKAQLRQQYQADLQEIRREIPDFYRSGSVGPRRRPLPRTARSRLQEEVARM